MYTPIPKIFALIAPKYQLGYYYMHGEVDSCRNIYADFGTCLSAKAKSKEEAQKMLKGTLLDKNKPSPTITVWEFKTKPGWI
jgi:hypothetical protein